MQTVEITAIEELNHNVRRYVTEKPDGYSFEPGQATEVAINKEGWRDEKRPFTFTSLPQDDHLEFVIKSYFDHDGVTKEMYNQKEGDELLIDDAWGAITYKGPGVFIAGGAGVTPFISILRHLNKEGKLDGQQLYFSNLTEKDIFLNDEFESLLGDNFHNVITDESSDNYLEGFIDQSFLEEHIDNFDQQFYICGPIKMVTDISNHLQQLGADPNGITFEE